MAYEVGKRMAAEAKAWSSKFRTLSLREAAAFDHQNGAREKVTPWGAFCKRRHAERKAAGLCR